MPFIFLLLIIFSPFAATEPNNFIANNHLYGYTQGQYGEKDCNPSIKNVPAALKSISGEKGESQFLSLDNNKANIPPVGITTHAQGVARIPGTENENWLVFTKSGDKPKEAGMIFVRFAKLQSNGKAWAATTHKDPSWHKGASQSFYKDQSHNQDHPGSIQMLGRTLVVGSDGKDGTLIDFYDASNPYRPQHLSRLHIDGSQGEREIQAGGKGASAHFVSAAKLRDGRFLLFVARHNRDLLKYPRGKGWFYISNSKTIDKETQWKYISFSPYTPKGNAYQSANLLTDKQTGNLYLAMMRPELLQKNYIDLWQLTPHDNAQHPDDVIDLKLKMTKTLWTRATGGTFDAGGGIHVTPEGKIAVYMIDRWQDFSGNINLDEYHTK